MGGASVAARKGHSTRRYQSQLQFAELSLDQLESMTIYPEDEVAIHQLYQSSEKLIRFLMSELPKDRIVRFIDAILEGRRIKTAVLEIYPDKLRDWDAFERRYERFAR
jgi:hypothetical protein